MEVLNNTEENNFEEEADSRIKTRPVLLSVVCVLSFIGSGMMLFSFSMLGLFHDTFVQMKDLPQFQMAGMEVILATPPNIFLIGAFFYLATIFGTRQMWNLKKIGFHVYTLSQFALIFLSSFYIFSDHFPSGDLMLSASFVLLYAVFLKDMA